MGDLLIQDMEKADVLNDFFASAPTASHKNHRQGLEKPRTAHCRSGLGPY